MKRKTNLKTSGKKSRKRKPVFSKKELSVLAAAASQPYDEAAADFAAMDNDYD